MKIIFTAVLLLTSTTAAFGATEAGDVSLGLYRFGGTFQGLEKREPFDGGRLLLSVWVSENIAAEGGVFWGSGSTSGEIASYDVDALMMLDGWSAGVKGRYGIASFVDLYGRVGFSSWTLDSLVSVYDPYYGSYHQSFIESGSDPYFGFGLSMLPGNWEVSLDYEQMTVQGEDLKNYGLGVGYRF